MQKVVIVGAIIIILLTGAYFFIPKSQTTFGRPEKTPPTISKTTPTPAFTYGPFVGTLPCADCSGLETFLTLTKEGPYTDEGTYSLKQRYLGKNQEPLVTNGNWTMIRGDATDENASVFQLNPEDPGLSVYYLKISDTEIEMLDNDLKKIDAPFPMTLKKQ